MTFFDKKRRFNGEDISDKEVAIMQVCAQKTCMGIGENIKNDPGSFIRGDQDAALITAIRSDGVYTSPGALQTLASNNKDIGIEIPPKDKLAVIYSSDPFSNDRVSSVEIVRNNGTDSIRYDVYVAVNDNLKTVGKTSFTVNKADNSVTRTNTVDVDVKNTPMYKEGNTGERYVYNSKLSPETNRLYNNAVKRTGWPTVNMSLADMRSNYGDKVMETYEGKFAVPMYGKYKPNMTFIVDGVGRMEGNVKVQYLEYEEYARVANSINIPFDASSKTALFGNYRLSKAGKPVFELAPFENAKHVLLKCGWGGAFDDTRGLREENYRAYVKDNPLVVYYTESSSNGGGTGNDYYVLNNTEELKAEYLKVLREDEIEMNRKMAKHYDTHHDDYYKPIMIDRLKELESELKEYLPYKDREPLFIYHDVRVSMKEENDEYGNYGITWAYEDAINAAERMLNEVKEHTVLYENTMEQVERWQNAFESYIQAKGDVYRDAKEEYWYGEHYAQLTYVIDGETIEKRYPYSKDGYFEMIENYKAIDKEREYVDIVTHRVQNDYLGIQAGLPETFKNWHREGGKTYLGGTLYLDSQAHVIEPVSIKLKNINHRHHYSSQREMINGADGIQQWGQMQPGDVVVAYSKTKTSDPLVLKMPHVYGEVTPEMKEKIKNWENDLIEKVQPDYIEKDENYLKYIG